MNISHIPSAPWVYLFKDRKEKILYVGKAKDLAKRVGQYFAPGSVWKQDMLTKAHHIDFIEVRNESEALYLEDNLIKTNNPEYNRLLKGDNSYIYLKITKEEFPQLFLTRMRRNDGATYIGPKNNTGDLRKLMHYLRQIYKYRSMKSTEFKQGKLSSDFYFWLDKGRSTIGQMARHPDRSVEQWNNIPDPSPKNSALKNIIQAQKNWFHITKTYEEYKREYKDIVKSITSFFEGNTKEVKKKILTDINEAIEKEHFEWCINLRSILQQIDQRTEKQHVVFSPNHEGNIISITPLENFWIIIIVKIYEGKITDVIRDKKVKEEWSFNQIKASLEVDFKEDFIIQENNHEGQSLLYSPSLKILKKSDRKGFDELLQKFIQSYIASTTFDIEENLTQDLLTSLQSRYYIKKLPYQIECIDISHFSGSAISGGLSCMREWLLYKPWYRHYKIKTLEDSKWNYSNDFLSLQEIIVRRFWLKTKKVTEYPDLFILDGGQGQLNILRELCQIFPSLQIIMQEQTTFIALGKGKARKESAKTQGETEMIYYFDKDNDIQSIPLIYDPADRLLTKLRDEAHRFANKYRTTRMSKQWK